MMAPQVVLMAHKQCAACVQHCLDFIAYVSGVECCSLLMQRLACIWGEALYNAQINSSLHLYNSKMNAGNADMSAAKQEYI